MKVGFNTTPTFRPLAEFWSAFKYLGGKQFTEALDYVGIDFFPDVFRTVAADGQPGDLKSATTHALESMRYSWLPEAGISAGTPIHIMEHGWPTGPTRSQGRQSEVLESVIRQISELSQRLSIEQ